MPIAQKPLKTLFDAMFHGKRDFADFLRPVADGDVIRSHFKQGTRQREIVSASERLRQYHRFLRMFLVDFLPVHSAVYSYRKGVSARDAVAQHSQSRSFFVTDIKAFFPSLTRNVVRQTIVGALADIPIADLADHLDHLLDLLCVDGVLPIGFSTSPGLSNAALYSFDVAFQVQCQKIGVIYTRYADDIVLSATERNTVEAGEAALRAQLAKMFDAALTLHPGKSRYLQVGNKIKLLGMVLLPNGAISIDSAAKQEIETMLHLYLRDRLAFNERPDAGEGKAEARLAGMINYANTVDQAYLDKLRRKYGAGVVDLFLHRSFG